jgi:hypothetical protein
MMLYKYISFPSGKAILEKGRIGYGDSAFIDFR